MPAKSLENLLNSNDHAELREVIRHAQRMDALVGTLRRALPAETAAGLVAANIRGDGGLVVLTPSPAWAARLRFEEEALLRAARETGATVNSCTVRVARP
jgi:hypothetical protein